MFVMCDGVYLGLQSFAVGVQVLRERKLLPGRLSGPLRESSAVLCNGIAIIHQRREGEASTVQVRNIGVIFGRFLLVSLPILSKE